MAGEVSKARLDGLKAGISELLAKVNALLAAEAYAENLPIIGTKLATATPALETLTKLSNALQTAVNVVASLDNLSSLTTTEVAQKLTEALAPQLADLKTAANGFLGTIGATVDGSGNIVLNIDMGRSVGVDFTLGDLGMGGLGLALAGQGNAKLAYNLDFRIGADATGFWFDPAGSNLSLGATVDLNQMSASGNLGILHFAVANIEDGDPAADADTLKFDIASTWNGSGLIRSFSADLVDFKASGDVDLDLKLTGDLSNAALPSISAEFHVDWNFSQSLLNGSGANSWSPATVGFTNVRYDFGSFVETTIRPVVEKLAPILGPVNDALAVLKTDFRSALPADWFDALEMNGDGQITLLDFIEKAAGLAGQTIDTKPIVALMETIEQVVNIANFLSGKDFRNDPYQIGDYSTTFAAIQGAADALSKIDVASAGTFVNTAPTLGSFLNGLASRDPGGFGAASANGNGASQLGKLVSNQTLSFPMIENPLSVIKLLIGQDADLFKFDMPAINLPIGMDAKGRITNPLTAAIFPIWPFPLVDVRLNVAMQIVADLAFGYDTAGVRYWMGQGSNPGSIADIFTHGFYFDDQRSGGRDVAEFVLRAAVELAVVSSVPGVTIGGGVNVTGEIALDIADALTNPAGKLYLSELPQIITTNPFGLFDVSGSVEAGARFWVDWPLGNIFNVSIPGVELLSFEGKQDASALGLRAYGNTAAAPPPPPGLADVIAGGLWLAVGPRAGERDIANTLDTGEQLRITKSGNTLTVTGFGTSQTFALADFTSIQADGAGGNDSITIAAGVATPARMSGGDGNDYLQGGDGGDQLFGGILDDYLVGGGGSDTLDGEDGNDRLEGGSGADVLRGGAGLDTVTYANSGGVTLNLGNPAASTGDAAGDTFDGIEIFEGSSANDTLIGSALADVLSGVDGDDTLQGMAGDDTLAPGRGTNSVDGGAGFDIVNYYNIPQAVIVIGQAGGGYRVTAGAILSDTLVNVEQVEGSANGDTMTGGDANDIFVGREGDDTLDGGAGDDTLVGGAGRDTLRGGAGDRDRASYIQSAVGVTASLLNPGQNTGEAIGDTYDGIEGLRGSEFDDTLSGDNAANLLQGGAGDDVLNGNGGTDTLQGGIGADTLNGGEGKDIASYAGSTGKVVLNLLDRSRDEGEAIGDSFTGIEVYQGSRFSDTLTGSDQAEELWGEDGDDRLYGMGGADVLLGGTGEDRMWGGAGRDTLMGGAEGDTLYGEDDIDTLDGEAGDDTLYGGAGDDIVTGGDGIDHLYGGDDNDTLTGGIGDDFVYGDGGDDVLSGGAGADTIDGGAGKDRVTYDDGATGGVKLNLSSTGRTLDGVAVAAFSALDTAGTVDTFAATGALAHVEDATGSARGDWIVANEAGSEIDALGGNDTLTGIGGGDTLRGGDGDDAIDAGGGDDTVQGGAGTNDLKGGAGTDWVSFADIGGSVIASLTTNTATKSLGGTDTLAGFENLRGSAGGDTLTGDAGVNRIEGLGGNDTLDGGGGADVLVGGFGDDIYFVDNASGDPTQGSDDAIIEQDGSDIVKSRVNYTLANNLEDLQLLGPATSGTGNASANLMIGNALNNLLDGRGGSDSFWGYAGDDTYIFDDLGDRIGVADANRSGIAGAGEIAGGGTDTIKLATANIVGRDQSGREVVWTYSLGGVGLDQVENLDLIDDVRRVDLTGNALGNRLTGNSWNQILRGEGGDDTLDPGTGKDTVVGGTGRDTLRFDWSGVTWFNLNISSLGGNATDGYYGEVYNRLQAGDSYVITFSEIERFEAKLTQGDDTLNTGDGDDIVLGNGGNDTLSTGKGFDVIDGGAGTADRWLADKSAASAAMILDLAAASTYAIAGGTGSVVGIEALGFDNSRDGLFQTGAFADVVTTRNLFLHDYIATNGGNDRVSIFAGKDAVHMGDGYDTLVVDWSGIDYAIDISSLAGSPTAGYYGDIYNRNQASDTNLVSFSGVEDFDVKLGSGNDTLNVGDGNDIVAAGAGNDTLSTGKGFDVIDGGDGADRWLADKSAASGAMIIDLATASTYTIAGGTGSVVGIEALGLSNATGGFFQTGAFNDVVTTRNLFLHDYIATNAGNDRVTVFGGKDAVAMGDGYDTLVIDWSGIGYAIDISSLAGSLSGGYSGDIYNRNQASDTNLATFSGVEDFDVKLGSGNDTLNVGDGNDIVAAGAGNDTLSTGKGFDIIDGGDGTDRWLADKSAATLGMTIDLTTSAASTYRIGTRDGSVTGIEALGFQNTTSGLFTTGSGNDTIVTRAEFLHDFIGTGDGDDTVTVRGGKDAVHMGAGFDTLIIDWSNSGINYDIFSVGGSLATGYWGEFYNSFQGGDSNLVNFSGVERFWVTAGTQADYVRGGDADDRLRGMGGDDTLEGFGGDDLLDGGIGNDTMRGGTGGDTYVVDAAGDIVIELAGEGLDTVQTALASYALAANVENLTGTSTTGGQTLTGNAADNVILGGAYGDVLDGGLGNDTLRGGSGDDFFVAGKGTNDQYFGDAGTDTVVLSGALADWEFTLLGDGRVKLVDTRDAANSVAFLSGIERVEIRGTGSWDIAAVLAGTAGAARPGTTGNDVVTTIPGGLVLLTQGGTDKAIGTAGTDSVLFGASYDPTDEYDGGAGLDEIGLQGNYTVTFGPGVVNVEALTLLSASDTRFGAPGTGSFSYDITFNDANVASGSTFLIQANTLGVGENLKFDGRAETNGSFLVYAGLGDDAVTGGKGSDGFFFGAGRFSPFDKVDGFEGPDDQLGIRGDYSTLVELRADTIRNISTFVLISSSDARFGPALGPSSFNIKLHDGNVAAGKTMTVQGNLLTASESARFDGSSETDGDFLFIGGAGGDTFIGGANADRFYGAAGADTLTGGGGSDVFIYLRSSNSTPIARDTITDFSTGDRIDLSGFDAVPGGGRDAFALVGDFTGVAGQLRVRQDGVDPTIWYVEGDTDGIGGADFAIKVISDHALTSSDFIL